MSVCFRNSLTLSVVSKINLTPRMPRHEFSTCFLSLFRVFLANGKCIMIELNVFIEILVSRDECEMVMHSDDAFAPVAYLNLVKMHLEDKPLTLNVVSCVTKIISALVLDLILINLFSKFVWYFFGQMIHSIQLSS